MKKLAKRIAILTFLGATGIFYGCGTSSSTPKMFNTNEVTRTKEAKETVQPSPSVVTKDTTTNQKIYVYICGQIKKPGVYTMTPGARVDDVVKQAGGMTKEASLSSVNLAAVVTDEQQIYIPSKEEINATKSERSATVQKGTGQATAAQPSEKININTASKSELMSLPGIGERKAESILAYRSAKGSFSSIEELTKVDGIKSGVLNKIKEKITV